MSAPRMLAFVFPLPENMANARQHWAVKYRKMKAYVAVLDERATMKRNPRAPRMPFVKARAEVDVYSYRIMDRDGATARVKWILDWLKTRGYIVDDKPSCLDLVVEPHAAPLKETRVTLRLTETL